MPAVPDASGARVTARALRGLNPNDIDPDEMDDVIMRIFNETRRQLSQMETIKDEKLEPDERERNARILAQLERTMERLVKLEAERSAARKSKAKSSNANAKQALRDKIDRIIRFELKGRATCPADE